MTTGVAAWSSTLDTTGRGYLTGSASGVRNIHEPPRETLPPETLIAGRYRVSGELGRGGFAVVYAAEHLGLQRSVALKVLHRSAGTPAVLFQRFVREVHISALVRHPHVLQVHDVGMLADGSPFLVMEKIQGETLYHHMCRAGRLSIGQAVALSKQLLSALVALAAHGIVHRDIKPENLMLTRTDAGELALKLVDFGIALGRKEQTEPRLTMHGALIGTPHYMAPEQLRAEGVDARVDIYATGVVMYQVLSGRPPFDGEDLGSLTLNVLHGTPKSLRSLRPDCPARLCDIVERALARDPACRYASAAEMLEALNDIASEPGILERVTQTLWPPALQRPRLGRAPRLGLAVALLAGCLLGSPWLRKPAGVARTVHPAPAADHSALSRVTVMQLSPEWLGPELRPTIESMPTQRLPARSRSSDPAALSPRSLEREVSAPTLCRQALALYLHGEIEAAYAAYRKAARVEPPEPSAFRGVGLSASRLGKTREARRAYARYLELVPKAADAEVIKARLAELIMLSSAR